MTTFKKEWTLETAMKILQHPTVDSQIWAEAVEWLLIYGPVEVKEVLGQASRHATNTSFPKLKPEGYNTDGTPCYSVAKIAKSLEISEEEATRLIAEKEKKHAQRHLWGKDETLPLQ